MERTRQLRSSAVLIGAVALIVAPARADWSRRMGDDQNTGNAGTVGALTPETVHDLALVDVFPVGPGNATPVAAGDLVVFGSRSGTAFVIDLDAKKVLVAFAAGGPITATPVVATVTVPDGQEGTREEERVYIGAYPPDGRGLWCLDLDGIRADRSHLDRDPGTNYVCDGAAYPLLTLSPTSTSQPSVWGFLDGSAVFSKNQPIIVDGQEDVRDVLFQPTGRGEVAGGEIWAYDAYSGERLWIWAPPNPLVPSTMWSAVSMNRARTALYITTSNLPYVVPGKPTNLGGGRAESVIAIDPATGAEIWYRQHRVFDALEDFDIGNGATVVDVDGEGGCHVVVVPDKDGCVYAYDQEPDVPVVGDPDYDRLRPGQQRLRWRQCLVQSHITNAFNAMVAAFDGRRVFVQAGGWRFPGDDVNGFALDACTGEVQWASSSIGIGRYDGAVASGMLFQMSGIAVPQNTSFSTGGGDGWVQVVNATDGTNLATLPIRQAAGGGGGVSILPDGRILVPSNAGVAVFAIDPDSNASPPVGVGSNSFSGARPEPSSTIVPTMERATRAVLDAAGTDVPEALR